MTQASFLLFVSLRACNAAEKSHIRRGQSDLGLHHIRGLLRRVQAGAKEEDVPVETHLPPVG